jgi:non-specific serine/threonine protein kinase
LLTPTLGFLRHDDGTRPERLRTMANAIAWSYGLLDEQAQRVLRRLAAVPAGFTADLAASIAGELCDATQSWPPRTPDQALHDALDELVNVSLLRFELRGGGASRYRMVGTVREYGLAQLRAAGDDAATYRAFADAVLAMTERLKPELRGDGAAVALEELEREHANIQEALRWSIAQGPAGSACALGICTAVWSFWKQRGHLRDAEFWLRESIAAAGEEESLFLGNGYLLLGHTISDQRAGWSHYERALEIYRRHGTTRHVAGTLNSLGHTAMGQGDYRRAKSLLMETLQIFERDQSDSNASDLAHVHYQLGLLSTRLRELESALDYFDQARVLWDEAGQTIDVLNAMLELGHVSAELGKFAVGRDLLSWALSRARATSDLDAEGRALCELGLLEAMRGDDALALQQLRAALQLYHDTGYLFSHLAKAVEALAAACCRHDRHELGATLLGFADNWRKRTANALEPEEEVARAKLVDTSKRRLGAGVFDVAWSRGQRLIQLDDVIAAVATVEVVAAPRAPVAGRRGSGPGQLTKREHQVLCLLATGLKYRDIAGELGIEESTVKKFIERIDDALDVNNRTAAAAYAFQHGLCEQA